MDPSKLLAQLFTNEELGEIIEQAKCANDYKEAVILKYIKLHKKKRFLENGESKTNKQQATEETIIRNMLNSVTNSELIIRAIDLKESVEKIQMQKFLVKSLEYFEKNFQTRTQERKDYLKENGYKLHCLMNKVFTCPQLEDPYLSESDVTNLIKTIADDDHNETDIKEMVELWKYSQFVP
jgi:hypothetical protein